MKDKDKKEIEEALIKRAKGYRSVEITKEILEDSGSQRKRHKSKGIYEFTEDDWKSAKEYFNNECAYCGCKKVKLTKDHFIPLNKGGTFSIDNIIPCCQKCNSSKKDLDFKNWYKSNEFYDENRELKVYKYLELMKSRIKEREKDNKGKLTVTKEVEKEILPNVEAQMFILQGGIIEKPIRLRLSNAREVRKTMSKVANMIANNKIDRAKANTIIYACNSILNSIRTDDLENRIQELEDIVNDK